MAFLQKKSVFLLIFVSLFIFPLFSQEIMENANASWSTVLTGKVISEPVSFSYGFCLTTDAKTVSAFSNQGKLLWEKSFSRSKDVYLYSLPYDFLLFFDNSKKIFKLINTSGSIIWEKEIPFTVNDSSNVFSGRDGRFFIKSDNEIYCYGMNGICHWSLSSLKLKNLPFQELPDGSLIVFTSETDGKTGGLRISPFGQQLEEITFAGEVTSALWGSDGVFLTFTDGTAGLFSLEKGFAKNKWVFEKKIPGIKFIIHKNKKTVCVLTPSTFGFVVYVINPLNGKTNRYFNISDINSKNVKFETLNESGLLLSDEKTCSLYRLDGTCLWSGRFENQNSKSAWNYLFYSSDNHFILCRQNWTLDAFLLSQNSSGPAKKLNSISYPDFIEITPDFYNYISEFNVSLYDKKRIESLKKGQYGYREEDWASQIFSVSSAYSLFLNSSDFGVHIEKTVFEDDAVGLEKILSQLSYLASSDSADYAAQILRRTNNPSVLNVILKGISECGYDPDGKMLSALEVRASKIHEKNVTSIDCICDAVLSICIYMGSPAYFSKGRNILKKFMSPNYDERTRSHVREVMKKLTEA